LAVELLLLTLTYVVYDAARGLVRGGSPVAVAHARSIASLEGSLGLLHEIDVQRALTHVPGITTLFDFGYDVFHLSVTGGVLLWLYFRHRDAYPRVRTTLLAATCLALVGFTVYPSAPPRLAGIGIADTLSLAKETAHSGALQFLYNPYAAMPSLHLAYAVIAGFCLYRWGGNQLVRIIGIAYPMFVAVEVVATGNHFFLDLVAGVAVDACALAIVSRVLGENSNRSVMLGAIASHRLTS
jgi:membrane-associated phospholipid phosphatase